MDSSAIQPTMDASAKEFDRVSSLFQNGESRKRKIPSPNLIVSDELLDSIGEELNIEKESGRAINVRWAEQLQDSYIEAASESSALN